MGGFTLNWRGLALALLVLPVGSALQAQAIKNEPPMRHFTEAEVAAVAMPVVAFEASAEDIDNFDKYFFFHRPDTSFDQAYADVMECDALSSGISIYRGADAGAIAAASAQYGLAAGAIGGVLAGAFVDAVFGSAERRKLQRQNMRTCMGFKGYNRYGLEKELWQEFNFAEGNGREEVATRSRALLMQARVASGPRPQGEVLEP